MLPLQDIAWCDTGEADSINGRSDLLPEKEGTIFEQAELNFRLYKRVGKCRNSGRQGVDEKIMIPLHHVCRCLEKAYCFEIIDNGQIM